MSKVMNVGRPVKLTALLRADPAASCKLHRHCDSLSHRCMKTADVHRHIHADTESLWPAG